MTSYWKRLLISSRALSRRFQGTFQHPWLQHGCFWLLSTYVLFRIFNQNAEYLTTDLIYTVLFQISLAFVVYLQLWLLIPRLLQPGRYLFYLLAFALSLRIGAGINWLTFTYLADWIFPGYYFISYYRIPELMQFMLIYAVLSTLLKLSKSWFDLRHKEKQINRLEREKLDAELQALKAQLDPHFLFNSLNSVYSLALDEDKNVPTYLLRLADNLRYMLYECRGPLVPLEKELEYVQNYLSLQRLRGGDEPIIEFRMEGEPEQQQVAPLLFIPFIENAFKHGLHGKSPEAQILIQFVIREKTLDFYIRNRRPGVRAGQSPIMPKGGGIGLENVQKRLQLLYPNGYELKIEAPDLYFEVFLHLDLERRISWV